LIFFGQFKNFARALFKRREALYELAKRDFLSQYKKSYLGFFWAYIQPLTYILLLFLVFTFGLRTNPAGKLPFVVYLISGMVAWLFFSQTLTSLTNVVSAHSFLVKKGNLNLGILHISMICSAAVTHLVLVSVSLVICWLNGLVPSLYSLQVVYYLIAMFILLMGLGWITSSTSLFVEDVSNVVTILTQFGFWFTPIVWNISMIPRQYHWIIKMNPVYYIVTGYRDSLIYRVPFWSKPLEALYFWSLTGFILGVGAVVFKKLRPHFGGVV
jgi:ABC-type polysaccharide/polyol phosphate export permease